MIRGSFLFSLACSGVICVAGCSQKTADDDPSKPTVDGSPYLLDSEPEGAKDVIAVRNESKDQDDVVIVGRIGGRMKPWGKDRATFTIVDHSLKACSDIPGDKCETPWDYCCETSKLKTGAALVKVVDKNGDVVKADARELLKVKELSTVVVKGKAERDDAGNLTVLATAVYVKKK